ncbi:MAG: hypothetical protein PHU25_03210 [Deltaproteobacteria bacterium]|nr:hypothetical protein [Deltaproteobacteria bacterium]
MTKRLLAVALCAMAVACGGAAQDSAQRPIVGIGQGRVVLAAQDLLLEKGYSCTKVDAQQGLLSTDWSNQPRRSTRYEVQAVPSDKTPGAVVVTVRALSRDRTLGGWSPEYGSQSDAENLLEDILGWEDTATEKPPITPTEPSCKGSADCPAGQHCGSGRCVSECTGSTDCGAQEQCDGKGRCVQVVEPVPPAPDMAVEKRPAAKNGKNTKTTN